MTSSTNDKCNCNCSTKSKFDALKEIDDLIKSIEHETDVRKIAETTHKCLYLLSLYDACEFMTKYQYPATPINILKFKYIAQQAYFIRLDIMKKLMLN